MFVRENDVKQVKCVDDEGCLHIRNGTIYDVLSSDGTWYEIITEDGRGGSYLKSRFEPVVDEKLKAELTFPFKVRCVDIEFSEGLLEFGKIYTATGEYMGTDYVLQGSYGTWSKDRFEIVKEEPVQHPPLAEQNVEQEYTGGSVSYYSVPIDHPTDPEKNPYTAECNDIIEALGMNYAEGNAFKAIWRSCAARKLGNAKKGYDDGLYDAEKVVFFGQRMVAMAKQTKMVLDFDPIS
jgi:hypothetical protein